MVTGRSSSAGEASTGAPGQLLPRFGARVIDSVILAVVGAILRLLLGFGTGWLTVQAILVFAYFVLLDVSYGTTLGKQLLGLRVTAPGGDNPTTQQAAIREAFTLLGVIPYIGGLLAFIAWVLIAMTINSSPTKQGKHDELAGGTRVVKG